jgi:hypothetical protein
MDGQALLSVQHAAAALGDVESATHRGESTNSASWGNCDTDLTRESILSPYPTRPQRSITPRCSPQPRPKAVPRSTRKQRRRIGMAIIRATTTRTAARSGSGESARPRRFFHCSRRNIRSDGAVDLSRSRDQRAAVERRPSVIRKDSSLVVAAIAGRQLSSSP